MATEEGDLGRIERVVEWVRAEKDIAKELQECPMLDSHRRGSWAVRYETLVDVYLRLTGRLEI